MSSRKKRVKEHRREVRAQREAEKNEKQREVSESAAKKK